MKALSSLIVLLATGCITVNMPGAGEKKDDSKKAAEAAAKPDGKQPAAAPEKAEKKEEKKPETPKAPEGGKPEAPKTQQPAQAAPAAQANNAKKTDEKKKDGKPFEDVIKEKEVSKGLFTTYKGKDNLYFAILPAQLGKNFLVFTTLSQGIGEGWLLTGMPLDDYVVRFEKREDRIELIKVNTRFKATKGTPEARALEKQFSESLIFSQKIETTDPETDASLIDMQPLLLNDTADLGEGLRVTLGNGYGIKKESSYFNDLRNFPKNLELNASLQFASGKSIYSETLPDGKAVRLGLHYSITELPESSTFRPRLADDRVGHFLTAHKSFDTKHEGIPAFDRYVERWNLEKADPSLPLSPPKKPITFYIENTTPYEYRDAVKEGILLWNKAFEAAGFKGAVQAVIMPDDADWDPADMRYNVIRWINSHESGFAGLGPSRVNPFTGEILDADVLIEGEAIRSIKRYYQRYVTPVTTSSFEIMPTAKGRFGCVFSQGMAAEANFAVLAMLTRGEIKAGDPVPAEFVHGYIVDLVAHEVGHVLGLRHNFKASTLHPVEKLHDVEATRSVGLVGSVMDYNGINVAPPGMKQGEYFPSTVGPYDVWAIEYSYTPVPDAKTSEEELPTLNKIASRCADASLAYATDEDTFGISLISPDPRNMTWDLGGDPLAFCKDQTALIREQLQKFPSVVVKEGDSFAPIRETFSGLLSMYARNTLMTCKYIGGLYMERSHKGDPGAKEPFAPVPAAKQREALEFLTKNLFAADAFQFEPETLRQLALNRWMHWGTSGWTFNIDFQLHDRILGNQRAALGWLFNDMVLRRILDAEPKFTKGEEPFRLPELFESIENSIWSDVGPAVEASSRNGTGGELNATRRGLQREHIALMTGILHNGRGYPEDARTLAYASLNRILDRISKGKPRTMQGYTGPHLAETETRIRKALEAHMTMPNR